MVNFVSTQEKAAPPQTHTPGPWYVSDFDHDALDVVASWSDKVKSATASGYGDYRGIIVCNLHHQNDNPCVSKAQAEANARLIAAAPELLEALEGIVNFYRPASHDERMKRQRPDENCTICKAESAIAKARGRQL